jgi:palmitoyltransferase
MFYLYIFLTVHTFLELHLFVFPHLEFRYWVLPINLFWLFVNTCFVLAAYTNPGVVVKEEGLSFEKLVEKCDPNGLCPTCEVLFTSDSRHCYYCNKCVHKFDHHCTWIN